ncbi:MAG: hypothetical protein AUG51_05410 [Acidobacteria bacterium 13_1_20CM_3_53_8]|nr:MAG: hypothetical protein AUG51_05410 [Acidobacteria bacterium 13_1_20CM_3_53_8]
MKNSNAIQDCLCDFAPLQETNLTQRLEDAKGDAKVLTFSPREQETRQRVAGATRARRLLLCLDGVPFDVIREAKTRGLFDGFNAPSRLLSPFPTMTNIALSAMLKASVPVGYESRYFDRNTRELRGGAQKYIGRRTPEKIPSTYMDELDYQEPLPFEYLVYFAPEKIFRADIQRFREKFRRAPQDRDYFAFLKGTDGLMHMRGTESLSVVLESLDRLLTEIKTFCGDETEVALFSDHGMNLEENRRVHLQTHLRRCGFQITNRLNGANDKQQVVLPAFGLIGFAALFCEEQTSPKLADALVPLEGIDFSLYRDGENIVGVKGWRGSARIHRRERDGRALYAYEQVEGDPLQLASIFRSLSEDGLMDAEGFASDEAWAERTGEHIYPDALNNLYTSIQQTRVRHPADVLVSLKDGYYYGSALFSRIVRLAATHGNAMRASTSAFLMSTHREFPNHVRGSEAQPLLRE